MPDEPSVIPPPPVPSADEIERFAAGLSVPEGVARAIAGSVELKERVEQSRRNNALLGELAAAVADGAPTPSFPPLLERVEGYRLVEEIHRGGQGIVYRAVQLETNRTVAVKVLLAGVLATSRQRRRFEREIELVAGLRHPNIVTVHHSGKTTGGRHYFVMEYLDGVPLNEHFGRGGARRAEEILPVFRKVCAAVGFAHQRGVIHRDLKPGNVLIDESGEPRVLDFGLAKGLTEGSEVGAAPGAAPVTLTGEFMGTLAYASPEQAAGRPELVDVRTDVYALGVMLYELLTGQFPYAVTGGIAEVVRHIAQTPPEPPSTWYARGPGVRGAPEEGAALPCRVGDELQTIVLKALAKEPGRRYQSALELERDLGHYLAGEPIEAKRDSALYVLRKTLRRYRLPLGVAAAFVVLLAAFGVVMAVQAQRLAEQRDAARGAKREAEVQAERAGREAVKARDVAGFFVDLFESARPDRARGQEVTVREALDHVPSRLTNKWEQMPELEGAVRAGMGVIYRAVGDLKQAEAQLRQAVALLERTMPGSPELAGALLSLGTVLREEEKWEEAERALRRGVEMAGAGGLRLEGMTQLGVLLRDGPGGRSAEARQVLEEALTGRRALFGAADERTLQTQTVLASLLRSTGDATGAEALLRPILERWRLALGEDHPETLRVKLETANCCMNLARYAEAADLYRDVVHAGERVLGEKHPGVLQAWSNYGRAVLELGDAPAAEAILRESLQKLTTLLGEDHRMVIANVSNLAGALEKQGKLEEARTLYEQVLETVRRVLGADHPWEMMALHQLGTVNAEMDRLDAAERYLRDSLEAQHRVRHTENLDTVDELGDVLFRLGRYDEAETMLLRAYDMVKDSPKIPAARKQGLAERIARVYEAQGSEGQATQWRARQP